MKNEDSKCFLWSVLAELHPQKHSYKPSAYKDYMNELDITGIDFPVELSAIAKFEKLNITSINVGPLHFTKHKREQHVHLLLINDQNQNSHYCYIIDLPPLVSSQYK